MYFKFLYETTVSQEQLLVGPVALQQPQSETRMGYSEYIGCMRSRDHVSNPVP